MNQSSPITTSKRLIYNTVLNMVTLGVSTGISFYLITFFLKQLGFQQYGVWILIGSIFQYRALLGMGLNSAVNWHIPVCLANQDYKGIAKVVSTSFFFLLSGGVILVFLCIILYLNLGNWFEIPPELVRTAQVLVVIVGLSFSLSLPLQISSAILSGIQRYDITNIITLLLLMARTILLVVLLLRGYGLLTIGFIFGGSEIMMQLLQFYFTKKLIPQATIAIHQVDFNLLREMTAYGTNTLLYSMGALILFKASDIIIGIFLGTSQISQFSIAATTIFFLTQFTEVFSSAAKPAVSDLDARADNTRVYEIAFLTQKYTLLMLIPASFFFTVMARDFLGVWVGVKIHDDAVLNMMASVMSIMTIAHSIRLAQHSNFVVLVGRGEHRMFGIFTIITAALFVVISLVCLKVFHLGLVAVAWSNFIPVVLISGIILPIYFNRRMQITMKKTISRVWLPALSGTLPAVVMILAWKYIAAPKSWLQIVIVIASAAIITCISSWFMSFSQFEQKRFIRLISRWPKIAGRNIS
jgi:O-antigen/teichoic acid export membrane protein